MQERKENHEEGAKPQQALSNTKIQITKELRMRKGATRGLGSSPNLIRRDH
jgi:hypothetical protein